MREDIKKILFNKLSSLPSNKILLWPDLQVAFNAATGESLSNHLEDAEHAFNELEAEKYVRLEMSPNHMPRIFKGVNFNSWGQAMNPVQNNNPVNIGSLNAQNVQIGSQNTQITNLSLAEVVKQVAAQNDAQAKGLLRQLLENSTVSAIVGAGTSALLGML
jgi:hypothetical protein